MFVVRDSIEIDARPETVFDWFNEIDEHYLEWHGDHVAARKDEGAWTEGTTFSFEERIGGSLRRLRLTAVRVEENQRIDYRMRGTISLLIPGGSFVFERRDGGCLFTASYQIRGGALLRRLLASTVEAMERHMREEGQNLKGIIEGD